MFSLQCWCQQSNCDWYQKPKSKCDWCRKFKIKLGLMSKINIKLCPCFGLKSSCARKKQIHIAMRLANLLFMTLQRQHIIHILNLHGHTRCLHPMRFRQNPRVLTTDKTWLQQKHQLEGLNSKTRTLNLARNLPCNDPARQEPSGILPGTFDETFQNLRLQPAPGPAPETSGTFAGLAEPARTWPCTLHRNLFWNPPATCTWPCNGTLWKPARATGTGTHWSLYLGCTPH